MWIKNTKKFHFLIKIPLNSYFYKSTGKIVLQTNKSFLIQLHKMNFAVFFSSLGF